jgi:F-type H+-transporting ATPase subunit b
MDIEFPQILFQLINFGVVAGALTYLLYKPVKKMLDERSQKVADAQKAAELTLAENHQIEEMKKKIQKDAEKAAAQIMADAKEASEKLARDMMDKAKKKADAEQERRNNEWQAEKATLIKQLEAKFANEVINLAEKVVGVSVEKSALSSKLIDESLANIEKSL